MFRQMRREKQQLPAEECEAILRAGVSGTLALSGDEGYPYALPMSYVYANGKIYFHGSLEGHKIDAIRACDKASFCVVTRDEPLPEKLTTLYRSVIVFGRVGFVEDESEMRAALEALCEKYCADYMDKSREVIDRQLRHLRVIALEPEHITGKESFELARMKKENAQ